VVFLYRAVLQFCSRAVPPDLPITHYPPVRPTTHCSPVAEVVPPPSHRPAASLSGQSLPPLPSTTSIHRRSSPESPHHRRLQPRTSNSIGGLPSLFPLICRPVRRRCLAPPVPPLASATTVDLLPFFKQLSNGDSGHILHHKKEGAHGEPGYCRSQCVTPYFLKNIEFYKFIYLNKYLIVAFYVDAYFLLYCEVFLYFIVQVEVVEIQI
jgi:hypothetical protein